MRLDEVTSFIQRLTADAGLRDAVVQYCEMRVAAENKLDRVDASRSLDFQRGMVAAYRALAAETRSLEPKGDENGAVR